MYLDQKIRFELVRGALGEGSGRLLEVGCGDGQLARALAEDGWAVHACDMPTPFGLPRLPRFFVADGRRLPVAGGSFDCVVCCEVLEHVPPQARGQFLRELVRAVRPGGTLVVTAFVRRTLSFRFYGAAWLLAAGSLPVWYAEHVTIPTPTMAEVQDDLAKAGATVLSARRHLALLQLFGIWVQNATDWHGMTRAAAAVRALDRVGRRTSCMIVARRRPSPTSNAA